MDVSPLSFGVHRRAFFPSLPTLIPVFFWKEYLFIYNHRLLLVIGLVFSRSLTYNAIVSVLIWYLTSSGDDVVKSAILTNVGEFLSSMFEIVMAHAADSFIGRFQTLLFSTIAYIGALMLFWMFHPSGVSWLLVLNLILLALGTSGDKILQDVVIDFVHDIDKSPSQNITRSITRATIWLRVVYVSGALIAILWVTLGAIGGVDSSWNNYFRICFITMTLAMIIFGVGHIVHYKGEILKYISRCLTGFSRQDKDTPDIEKGENEGIRQGLSTLHLETKQKEDKKNTNFYKQDDVFIIKSLLRLFPMWGVFIVVSIMTATGSTFFSLQYSNLNTDNDIAVQIYYLVQEFLKFAIPHLYHWICCLPNEKIKIGVGMICGVMSCIFAWQLEVYRLKEVSHLVNEDPNTSISFLWLVPQFCLLGCMEGLTKEGLLELYKSQMKEEQYLQRYREEYIEFAMGLGKLLNIVLILILKGWFGDTINDSRLDKYYVVLVCVGAANFITYCCIARFFYKEREFANDDDDLANANLQQDDSIKENRDDEQNQDLGEDDKQDDKKKKVVE